MLFRSVMMRGVTDGEIAYLTPEARARVETSVDGLADEIPTASEGALLEAGK